MTKQAHTALVTGASSGIGEQFAVQLAARGYNLVLSARSGDRLQALAQRLVSAHPQVQVDVVTADLAVPGGAARLVDDLTARGTQVDVLVNNAGFGSHDAFVDEDPDNVVREIQLNCSSLVELTSRLLPAMMARRQGGVLNVASTAAFQPIATMAVYGATKAFVLSFTEALWAETRKSGVRVMALCPGPTDTAFFDVAGKEFLTSGRQSPEQVAEIGLKYFFDGSGPSVIPGTANKLKAHGYRIVPRSVMAGVAGMMVRAH